MAVKIISVIPRVYISMHSTVIVPIRLRNVLSKGKRHKTTPHLGMFKGVIHLCSEGLYIILNIAQISAFAYHISFGVYGLNFLRNVWVHFVHFWVHPI